MDRLIGLFLLVGGGMLGIYYSTWVIVLPFVDKENVLQMFFPPKVFAIAFPLAIGVIGLLVIGLFASVTMSQRKGVNISKKS